MNIIHFVFFLVHFMAWVIRNTLAFGISAPSPKSPILLIPCFSWIPVLTNHSTVSSCHGSIQDKAAPWAITGSYTCSCGTTQCQSFLLPKRTWLIPGPIKGDFPGPFMHFESWDLPVNLGSYHPTQHSHQWQRIQLWRDRGWWQDIQLWSSKSLTWARASEHEFPMSWHPQCAS